MESDLNRRLYYKQKTIRFNLGEQLRKNICSLCGKKYPDDLKLRTNLHHVTYNDEKPLEGVIEVCNSCHAKLHFPKGKKIGWDYENGYSTIKHSKGPNANPPHPTGEAWHKIHDKQWSKGVAP
jgi:hypothetical protein